MTILILSNTLDPHVSAVEAQLKQSTADYFRLDTDTLDRQSSVSFSVRPPVPAQSYLSNGKRCIELSSISAVWYRRPELPEFSALRSAQSRQFARHETQALIDNLVSLLDLQGVRWLSHPEAIRRAGCKIRQLNDAMLIGLSIPPTIVTTNPVEIREFADGQAQTIAKLVSKGVPRTPNIDDQYTIFTNILTPSDLANSKSLSACAAQYQPYVEKAFELRVTVVGDSALACRIDSQSSDKTKTDWRKYDLPNTPHSIFKLDDAIADKCRSLVKLYGLTFAAIDLIVMPDGQTVFLELNPNGQWLWLEELTGLPIAATIAKYLSSDQ